MVTVGIGTALFNVSDASALAFVKRGTSGKADKKTIEDEWKLVKSKTLWVGDDRTEEAVRPFFTKEMGKRRRQTPRVVCMDMWAPYAKLVRDHAVKARILFDRCHIVKHLNEAVDAARRDLWRRLTAKERVWRAKQHLLKWMNPAMRSKLEPFKKFVRMLRSHLDGVLA